jgi:hypothetical protein
MSDSSLLLAVKRKSDFGAVRAAFDPSRKSARLPLGLVHSAVPADHSEHEVPGVTDVDDR